MTCNIGFARRKRQTIAIARGCYIECDRSGGWVVSEIGVAVGID